MAVAAITVLVLYIQSHFLFHEDTLSVIFLDVYFGWLDLSFGAEPKLWDEGRYVLEDQFLRI
jgi:hypothetical protein